MATAELLFQLRGDPSNVKQVLAMVREDLSQTSKSQDANNKKQIQNSAAIIAQWKQEQQTAKRIQNEIESAHRQREQEVSRIAKQESQAWTQHERQKLSTTRQAEKQGEQIVAQSAAAREATAKRSDAARAQATRVALQDVRRIERERAQIVAQSSRAIESLAKLEANTRIREAKRAASEIISQLKQQHQQELALQRQALQPRGGGSSAFLAGAVGGVSALIGLSAVSEIRNAASAWVDYSSKLETTKIAFTTMLGSAQAAEDHLKELQAFALKTPFQFSELIDASQRMQALGFSASQIIPILTDVGNAVAAAGGGSERLDRVVLALSQMQSKGKVATQELNQLAESGIGGFKILEQQLGKSRAELIKMVEAGEISSRVFLEAFQKFSQQNFGGLMEAQSKTFTGAMSNIKDALLQTSATAFAPLFQRLSETARHFSEASQKSDEFKRKLEGVGQFASTVWDGAAEAIRVLKDAYSLALTALFAQFELLEAVLTGAVRQFNALYFAALAYVRLVKGDYLGALDASNKSQREQAQVADSVAKALKAEGKIIEELTRIYNDAAAAAKRLKDERSGQTVGADPGGGFGQRVGADPQGFSAGVFRKVPLAGPADTSASDKARSQAQARANRAIQLQQQALEEQTRKHREALERERDLEIKNADQWEIEAKKILEDHRKAQETIFDRELANARQFITDKKDLQLVETEIQQKRVKLANDVARELLKIEDEAQKRNDQIALKAQQSLFRVNESFRQGQSDLQRRLLDDQSRTESDFLSAQLRLLTESHEERKKLFKAEEEQASLTAARLRELNEERAIAEQEFTNQFEDLVARRIAAREREIAAEAPGARGVPEPSGRVLSDRQIGGLGQLPDPGPTGDVFRDINRVLVETLGLSNSVASSITDVLSVSFGNLASAVGEAVRAFVLFGSVQGGFKRFAAEVIASIAQMAIVQAVWEAAQGLAMLALGYFTSNPKYYASAKAHFAAAAVYGLIGGVAAVAGRAVAGNSFSGGGTGGEGGSRERPQPLTTIISGRNQAPNPTVRHVIDVRVGVNDSEFGRTINAHIVRNVGDGGELREVIQRDQR